jgi:hypothetical protein
VVEKGLHSLSRNPLLRSLKCASYIFGASHCQGGEPRPREMGPPQPLKAVPRFVYLGKFLTLVTARVC